MCVKGEVEKYDYDSKSLIIFKKFNYRLGIILNGKDVLHTLKTSTGDNTEIKNKVCTLIYTNMIQVLSQSLEHENIM